MIFIGIEDKKEQLCSLFNKIPLTGCENYVIEYFKGGSLRVAKNSYKIKVTYANDSQLFRSVLLSAELIKDGIDREICEEEQFRRCGVMFDMSRAGVMNIDAIKNYIEYMALFGLNAAMLYMEDVYEVEGLPYFGYMRGRYTKDELREIDRYGSKYGIEIIPCIQTLGHLEQYIKWSDGRRISDTPSVILPGVEESLDFIDKLLSTVSECFTSRLIHIGMDEAWGLGTGNYLKKYGYANPTEIFCDHLAKVKKLTEKYGLKPMIWSDMYFRLASSVGQYYDADVEFEDNVKELVPDGVGLVYWDYYNPKDTVSKMLGKHRELTDNVIFAGAVWLWAGLLPDYKLTVSATDDALYACKEKKIKDVYATLWGDDGCETDVRFALPGIMLYGEHAYNAEVDQNLLDKRLRLLFGTEMKDFERISDALYPLEKFSPQRRAVLSAKQIVYNDILCGLADYEMRNNELPALYEKLYEEFDERSKKDGVFKELFEYVAAICKVCCLKTDVCIKLHAAYGKDNALLRSIADTLLPKLLEDYSKLKNIHYKTWHESYKPFGFEIVDGRYGWAMERIRTAILRITEYLNGEVDSLPELCVEKLPFASKSGFTNHTSIASAFRPKGW